MGSAVAHGKGEAWEARRLLACPLISGPARAKPAPPPSLHTWPSTLTLPPCSGLPSSPQVLSTRIYRGQPPPGADSGIEFVSFGGVATLVHVEAHEMGSAWETAAAAAAKPVQAQAAAAAAQQRAAGAASPGQGLASPRAVHVLHPSEGGAGAGAGAAPLPEGSSITEADFKAAVVAALAEGGGGGGAGSRVASPRADLGPVEEVTYSLSPHAAAY